MVQQSSLADGSLSGASVRFRVEIGTPNRAVRRRILEKHVAELPVRSGCVSRMAENEQRPPSVVERAANVVVVLEGESSKKVAQALGRVLGNWGGLIATDT